MYFCMQARIGSEVFYGKIMKADFKVKICRYFMNYCNNHHISSTNDGLSAMVNIKKWGVSRTLCKKVLDTP